MSENGPKRAQTTAVVEREVELLRATILSSLCHDFAVVTPRLTDTVRTDLSGKPLKVNPVLSQAYGS